MKSFMVAVITGDIVNSTKLSKAVSKRLYKDLAAVLKNYKHEFYRGDSLQILIENVEDALGVLLLLRVKTIQYSSSTIGTDIRAAVGIGKAALPINSVLTATDEAFVLSGRALDDFAKNQILSIVSNNEELNQTLRLISKFAEYIMRSVTAKQALVLAEIINEKTQTEIAGRMKKSQATVNKQLKAAGWSELQQLMTEYKTVCKKGVSLGNHTNQHQPVGAGGPGNTDPGQVKQSSMIILRNR